MPRCARTQGAVVPSTCLCMPAGLSRCRARLRAACLPEQGRPLAHIVGLRPRSVKRICHRGWCTLHSVANANPNACSGHHCRVQVLLSKYFIRSAQAFRAPPAAAARRSRGAPVSVARARVCARARARHERGGRAAGRGARRSVVGGRRGRVGLFAGGGALREAARAQGQRRRQVRPRGAAREVGGAGAHARARGRRRAAFFLVCCLVWLRLPLRRSCSRARVCAARRASHAHARPGMRMPIRARVRSPRPAR